MKEPRPEGARPPLESAMLTGSALTWTYVATGIGLIVWVNLIYAVWRGRNHVGAGTIRGRTAGEIIESEVEVAGSHCSDEAPDCAPRVRYSYRVADKSYEGDRIRLVGRPDTTRKQAELVIAKYPVGRTVDVLYDPKNPNNAVLEGRNGIAPATYMLLTAFTAIMVVMISQSIAGRVLTAGGIPIFVFLLPVAAIALAISFISRLKLRSNAV